MKRLTIILLLILPAMLARAQSGPLWQKAREAYSEYDFNKTVQLLSRSDTLSTEALRMLANSYFYTGDYQQASQTYQRLIARSDHHYNDLWAYIKTLRILGNYGQAAGLARQLASEHPGDLRAALVLDDPLYHQNLPKAQATVENLAFNDQSQDFAPVLLGDKLVFTSSRMIGKTRVLIWPGNQQPFYDVLVADFDAQTGQLSGIKPMNINSVLNEANPTFSGDGQIMIYSANYTEPAADGKYNLRLIEARKQGNKWQETGTLDFCSPEFSTTHPYLTPDGNTLYFASNRPGGYGGMDIYVSYRQADGSWSAPQNLGTAVNTEGNEVYPCYFAGYLFFASDGRPGLGGLDLFAAKIKDKQALYSLNLGNDINSTADDFAIFFDKSGKWALFSSNRSQGKGSDDIYKVTFNNGLDYLNKTVVLLAVDDVFGNSLDSVTLSLPDKQVLVKNGKIALLLDKNSDYVITVQKDRYQTLALSINTRDQDRMTLAVSLTPVVTLNGIVTENLTGKPLSGVQIRINIGDTTLTAVTGATGQFSANVPLSDRSLSLSYEKDGYQPVQQQLTFNGGYADTSLTAVLIPARPVQTLVFFDFDKAHINRSQADKLQELVLYLKQNPSLSVTITGYTDSRGAAVYNQYLSQRRAKAVTTYLAREMNVSPSSFTYRGMGETQPFVVDRQTHDQYGFLPVGQALTDDFIATLTPEQRKIAHSLNRRVEVKITRL